MSNAIQYSIEGGSYARCGETVKVIPPGFYDVVNLGFGNFGLKPKEPVTDELIDMAGTIADDIIEDIERFMRLGPTFASYNLTHKRGYLFYGPPGSGKTSLGLLIARRFIERTGGVVMYVSRDHHLTQGVGIIRDVEPGRPSMYLIEEADNVVDDTDCLSILDGECSLNGAVFVAMTNYKDRMAQRITNRPGRFDRVELVDRPPTKVQEEYLRRVISRGNPNDGACRELAGAIVRGLDGVPIQLAHLREAFISHVLMSTPMTEVRRRFETMAAKEEDDEDSEDDSKCEHEFDSDGTCMFCTDFDDVQKSGG